MVVRWHERGLTAAELENCNEDQVGDQRPFATVPIAEDAEYDGSNGSEQECKLREKVEFASEDDAE